MIRSVKTEDAESLLDIYSYYVEQTAISFEYEAPTAEEFRERIRGTLKKYPYLVAEDRGKVMAYAYAGPLKKRRAYDHCCELSIYVQRGARGCGYGRALYEAMEQELARQGIRNLYACIASPIGEDPYLTNDSEHFHQHMGYVRIGEFHRCGYKFGRWYNMIWMEKILEEQGENPDGRA